MDQPRALRETLDQPSGAAVVIPANLVGILLSYLREAGEHERGGVLLGRRDKTAIKVTTALFPPQLQRDRVACSFDVTCLSAIHTAKDMLDDQLAEHLGTIVGWIHSHPGHGLFLSHTDVDTLSSWRQLDPEAVAVVADPFVRGGMRERLAWWGAPGAGRYVTLDPSRTPALTIRQVAQVAEALDLSAAPNTRWDIVTARMVVRITASASGAEYRPPARASGRAQAPDRRRDHGEALPRDSQQDPGGRDS